MTVHLITQGGKSLNKSRDANRRGLPACSSQTTTLHVILTANFRSCLLQEEAQQIAEQSGPDATSALAQQTPDAAHILAPMKEAGKQVAGLPGTRAASVKDIIAASGADRETPR